MIILNKSDIVAAIDSFLAGDLDAAGLEEWAERYEMDDNVEYAEVDIDVIPNALFMLATPEINGDLTPEHVMRIRSELLGGDPGSTSGNGPAVALPNL